MNQLITIESKPEWIKFLDKMTNFDFYHTYDYHKLSVQYGQGKPILFGFSSGEYSISLPLLLRNIENNPGLTDLTSVYGYVGPLSSHKVLPPEFISDFQKSFSQYLNKNNIISVFSRLHPVFENDKYLINLGEIVELSETVFINLELDLADQRKQYRKGVKSDISKLNREGLEIFHDEKLEHVDEFIKIYNENMQRVNAEEKYYFNQDYYNVLFNSSDIDAKLYFVRKENELIAASIFIYSGDIIQYHLSGTKGDYLRNSPVRLLIDFIRTKETNSNSKIFHLGGGLGSNEDSLFNFKAGFSKERLKFKIWKYIVDSEIYKNLVTTNNVNQQDNYFPLYRANAKPI